MSDNDALTGRLTARIALADEEPIGRLIVDEIWLAAVEGAMASGERLPTARHLAVQLGISPRVVEHAYEELQLRGVVNIRPGEGTFIRLEIPSEAERERHRRLDELCGRTLNEAEALGFDLEEVIACLTEYRFRASGER